MQNYTKAQIAEKTLKRMKVLGLGQTASAEDRDYLEEKLGDLHDYLFLHELTRRGNYSWESNLIPSFAADAYEIMLMSRCSNRYGRETSENEFLQGMRLLRQVTAAPAVDELQEAVYY